MADTKFAFLSIMSLAVVMVLRIKWLCFLLLDSDKDENMSNCARGWSHSGFWYNVCSCLTPES